MNAPDRKGFFGRLSLEAGAGTALSDIRIRLLEEIESKGSINQAAKAVPLSYKAAWDSIDTLNNLSPQPLVTRSANDRRGGTQLTDYGRRVVAMYRALEADIQTALQRLEAHFPPDAPAGIDDFRRILKRMAVKSSARNQFAGPVKALRESEVDCEVCLPLDCDTEIVSVITRASMENMNLAVGREVCAMVKASSVMIATDNRMSVSARNRLQGEITLIHTSPVNDEVTLTLPSGKNITAVITHASRERLELAVGMQATAFFKASSVILTTCD